MPARVVADRFVLDRLLGRGGFAVVHRARDTVSGRLVALKIFTRGTAEDQARFLREAATLARIAHPGVVRYEAHGVTADGVPYLATELVEGETLAERLGRGALSVDDTLRLARIVVDAVAAVHAAGLVHRDLKPSNVVLSGGDLGRPRLIDFGLARKDNLESTLAITRPGAVVGTAGYLAPEQARGHPLDARADVFALGSILFECLTGEPAFRAESAFADLAKTIWVDAPLVSDLRTGVPERLTALIARMLAKDPVDRPEDATAVGDILSEVVDDPRGRSPTGAPSALTRDERRLVSVVLARSSETAPTSAEDESPTLRALRDEAHRFGTHLEVLADGRMLLRISGRGPAADQARRAARCALALLAVAPEIAIAVATGAGRIGDGAVVGEVIERASLAATAQPSRTIRLDETTAALLGDGFVTDRDGSGALLAGVGAALSPPTRTLLGRPTPFVGRDHELELIEAAYAACVRERTAQAIEVLGPPGAGKSRLGGEVLQRIAAQAPAPLILRARRDVTRDRGSLGLVQQMLQSFAEVDPGDSLAVGRDKLAARVGPLLPEARSVHFIAELAELPFPEGTSQQLDAARRAPALLGDQVRRAWIEWVEAQCRIRPVVLALDDVQWIDTPSANLVGAALRALTSEPLFVMALARPEADARLAKLWSDIGLTALSMRPLAGRAIAELAEAVLGPGVWRAPTAGAATDERLAWLARESGGNALLLEELIRALAEGKRESAPGTVLAMLHARIEALPAATRRALRAASVFGRTFCKDGTLRLLSADASEAAWSRWMRELSEDDLVIPVQSAWSTATDDLQFRGALVRDAAYESLTDEDRRTGHRLAADWLVETGDDPDRAAIAAHYESAAEPLLAVPWWHAAAERALRRNDYDAVLDWAARGAEHAHGELRGELHLLAAEASHWCGRFTEARENASAAAGLLSAGAPAWCKALGLRGAACAYLSDQEGLLGCARDLLAAELAATQDAGRAWVEAGGRVVIGLVYLGHQAPADDLAARMELVVPGLGPAAEARLDQIRSARALAIGDSATAVRHFKRLARHHQNIGDLRNLAWVVVDMGFAYSELGRQREASRWIRLGIDVARRVGASFTTSVGRSNLGLVLIRQGRLTEARSVLAEALAGLGDKNERTAGFTRQYVALVDHLEGRPAEAEREVRAALALLQQSERDQAFSTGLLARILLAAGRTGEALEAARRANALLERAGGVTEGEAMIRLVYAEALLSAGDDGAAEALRCAEVRLLERADRIRPEAFRRSFLDLSENARTLALSRKHRGG